MATDVSPDALVIARANAVTHGVDSRVQFLQADLLPALDAIDLIVSNPPYIPQGDEASLAPEVRDHEPHVALFGGVDGLDIYRRLFLDARRQIRDTGRLIVEVGYDQAGAVTALARSAGWELENMYRDLQGIERVLTLKPLI
jgi:release factor glutamine methyltransferase